MELTPALVEHALHAHTSSTRGPNLEPRLPMGGLQRPTSPPHSSEEGRSGHNIMARVPSSSSSLMKERGLPLNLAEPLDSERQHELAGQNINTAETLAPISGGIAPERRAPSPRNGKPQLSVSVPPRKERGLRPMTYDGAGGGAYEFDGSDDDEDDENQNDSDQDQEQGDTDEREENLVVRLNSRPSSRGATPPPGPSILRHPIPTKSELGSTITLGLSGHIRFTGPPKDHPHPNHHPLKPTDVILVDKPPPNKPQADGLPGTNKGSNVGPLTTIAGLPASSSTVFQQSTIISSRPLGNAPSLQEYPIQGISVNTSHTSTPSDQSKPPQATAVAPSLLPSSITCPSTSQPGPSVPSSDSINCPPPPENEQASQMPPPRLSSLREPFGPSFERALPPLPLTSVSAISPNNLSTFLPGSSSLGAHSRNGSVSTNGQTHVPSGTLSAFGRRPSVSNTPQGANGGGTSGSVSRLQLEQMSPSALMERSSTTNTATSSSSTPSLRSFTIQTQGMTEAQAQAARSRAKWAAEEQGLTIGQSIPTPPLPRSPPLTPPISPPRSLNADEAGRVRRDGVEKMRREAERRREEDEKRRLAEQQREAEAKQQLKLDEERKAREIKDRAAQEEKRRAADLQRKTTEEELGKRRVEERIRVREKFAQVKGTDEVFLTGHVSIQVQNSTTWRRRFYELAADGCLRLYKTSDAPDRVKALDLITIKGARSINRNVDELELIPYAFQVQLADSATSTPIKARRRSSFDKLTAITAGESMIPVRVTTPGRRPSDPALSASALANVSIDSGAIPEGVPIEFGVASPTNGTSRSFSPTRTLSRIPVSSVGHARTLADDGHRQQRAPSPTTPVGDASLHADASFRSSTLLSPMTGNSGVTSTPTSPSPGYRRSLVGGGTTKVLADLQAHTLQVKSVLENTKSQLRSSQRTIAQLTRQTEDLKDGRERLRIENESLNNVVSRKERLLQEAGQTADRARKAEAEVLALRSQLKDETLSSKKSMKEMQTTLSQAKAVAQRSEREYVQLRETLTGMREGWRREVESLREQMRGSQNEAQEALFKQATLLEILEEQKVERAKVEMLHAEYRAIQDQFTTQFRSELAAALATVERSARDCDGAGRTAKDVADELARLQRLIRAEPALGQ
ncbi:unnamed protein product [Rhizoctonia solani]|uniref:PH domain-containing protein n=1 Tax=Rhizoctonia solani TaxID=456999 RepID=A0A8H3DX57_9AGAM|nr:unnamed protein product [Rhizoctonia solani]